MPPRKQFSQDQVVEAALAVAQEVGLDGLTARRVAERLGASVAPIYVNFADVDELKHAVVRRLADVGRRMLETRRSDNRFLDIAAVSLHFANEYPHVFRDLVLNENTYLTTFNAHIGSALQETMAEDESLGAFDPALREEILFKMRIFQLGLSVMVANRLVPPPFDTAAQLALLEEVGQDAIWAARRRKEAREAGGDEG